MSSTNEIEHGSATMDPVPMEVNETPVPSLEESLNLGLDDDVKQQFWSETWPELTNEGWIKVGTQTVCQKQKMSTSITTTS